MKMHLLIVLVVLALFSAGCSDQQMVNDFAAGDWDNDVSITAESAGTAMKKARILERRGQWLKADVYYRTALKKFKKDKLLGNQYRAFKRRYEAKKRWHRAEAMISKARWLKQESRYRRMVGGTDISKVNTEPQKLSQLNGNRHNPGHERAHQQDQRLLSKRQSQLKDKLISREKLTQEEVNERLEFAKLVKKGRALARAGQP